ncbi:MAG: hypothetical protein DWQ36_22480 [Acidobacteria bacterium]|nr:MAG: hypothetical protein DWQ30_13790 [Acidobacteriota bacterium]REK00530.1 MAG: hypothetical protein DWQ36_22480 [Acidobacteriota bacterium]
MASCSRLGEEVASLELVGSKPDLERLLRLCAAVSKGPLPRACGELLAASEGLACPRIEARCAPGRMHCDLAAALRCAVDGPQAEEPGPDEDSWRMSGPLTTEGGSWSLRGGSLEGQADVLLELTPPAGSGLRRAFDWLPQTPLPGEPRLAGAGAAAHLRWRPRGGIDLTARSGEPSMADRLYGLRNELFSQAVLDGSLEAVLYPPRQGGEFPGLAAALGVRVPSAAVAAMERYLDDVQRQWPFTRQPYTASTAPSANDAEPARRGTCLVGLRVLPELAPCYVLDDDALVLGWNRDVLERALAVADVTATATVAASATEQASPLLASGELARLDFALWELADRRLAAARQRRPGLSYPLRDLRVSLDGATTGSRGEVRLRLRLGGLSDASPPAGSAPAETAAAAAGGGR